MGDLEAHGAAALAAAQLFLDRLEQIVGLVLVDAEVRVARDAERAAADDAEAGEQIARVHRDEILEQHEREARRGRRAGHRPGASGGAAAARTSLMRFKHRRHLDDGDDGLPLRDLLLFAVKEDREVEAAVAEHGERVARVDGERRQHRPDLAREIARRERALCSGVSWLARMTAHAGALEPGADLVAPHAVLLGAPSRGRAR